MYQYLQKNQTLLMYQRNTENQRKLMYQERIDKKPHRDNISEMNRKPK